jgi:hypothetical protein
VVPEQALQGQEALHAPQADAAAAREGQYHGLYRFFLQLVTIFFSVWTLIV